MTAPAPGTLGIGVGKLYTPIVERGEDPAGHFESSFWFPYSARAEAEEFAAADPRRVLRDGVPL